MEELSGLLQGRARSFPHRQRALCHCNCGCGSLAADRGLGVGGFVPLGLDGWVMGSWVLGSLHAGFAALRARWPSLAPLFLSPVPSLSTTRLSCDRALSLSLFSIPQSSQVSGCKTLPPLLQTDQNLRSHALWEWIPVALIAKS